MGRQGRDVEGAHPLCPCARKALTRAARSATAPLHPPAPHALNPLRCVQVVASTLPVGCAAHFVALASPSLLLMVRSYGFQLRLDAHLATQLAALLAMMPACTHKCRAELTRPGAADLFVRTASAVGRGLHASRAFLLPLFVVRGAAPCWPACELLAVGCGLLSPTHRAPLVRARRVPRRCHSRRAGHPRR